MVSPGINVTEYDLTNIIPSVATTDGAISGVFRWGPIGERVIIADEGDLGRRFGTPSNLNPETWFTSADFLSYGHRLHVVRAAQVNGTILQVSDAAAGITNASANVTLANTTGIEVGMLLFYSNTSSLVDDPGVEAKVLAINSTAIVLDTPARSTATGANLIFRTDSVFAAVAQETYDPNISWGDQLVTSSDNYPSHDGNFDPSVRWIARYGGYNGNSLRVSQCDSPTQFSSTLDLGTSNDDINATATYITANVGSSNLAVTVTAADMANGVAAIAYANAVHNALAINDLVQVGNSTIGYQIMKVVSVSSQDNTDNVITFSVTTEDAYGLAANVQMLSTERYWEFYNLVEQPPTQSNFVLNQGNTSAYDELHVVVIDEKGAFTNIPGAVLEVYKNLSRASDAVKEDGTTIYYKNVINNQSPYIWFGSDRSLAVSNTAQFVESSTATSPISMQLFGGSDGEDEATVPLTSIINGYNLFVDTENVDISLIMQGKARGIPVSSNTDLGNYLINNIAEKRKDCVVFVSPDYGLVVNNKGNEVTDMVAARNNMPSSSYGVMDSGYKYRYDRYNDLYRWTPLNGDIAGLCARTDQTNAPWWSPAGLNRGQIKNVVRLALNPNQTDRDILYKNSINPVVTFPGQGTLLYGDKTLLTKPSAFDRINVRRLFIVLEKAISTAAKYMLFEFNDAFTRSQFKSMVNPYLANIKGRRGIYDSLVVCDTTNNTPEIIDANQFVGDIYVKPARSINFIQLNFVAVPTGVAFQEIQGKFGG